MLENIYEKLGVPVTDVGGTTYPEYLTHPAAEYGALTRSAGIIDLTHWCVLRLTGGDRLSFLQAMLTNDVGELEPYRAADSLITTTKGKIIAELIVLPRKENVYVLVCQGDADQAKRVLERHIISEDVTIEDVSTSYGIVAIEGPKAYDCLWRMFPTGPFPKEPLQAVERQFEHIEFIVLKHTVSGEDGYELIIPAHEVERLYTYLVQASRGSDGLAVGRIAWNMRRIESGLPWYGVDFTDDNFPHEARLEHEVSYSKGCFLGQETLARLKYRGHVNRELVGLAVEGDRGDALAASVAEHFPETIHPHDEEALRKLAGPAAAVLNLSEGFPGKSSLVDAEAGVTSIGAAKSIGWTTSAAYSPKLQRPLLLGYVRHELAEVGHKLRMECAAGECDLRITDLPLT